MKHKKFPHIDAEPFGPTYSLKDAKQDSDDALSAWRLTKKLKNLKQELGFTMISMMFVLGWIGLGVAGMNV